MEQASAVVVLDAEIGPSIGQGLKEPRQAVVRSIQGEPDALVPRRRELRSPLQKEVHQPSGTSPRRQVQGSVGSSVSGLEVRTRVEEELRHLHATRLPGHEEESGALLRSLKVRSGTLLEEQSSDIKSVVQGRSVKSGFTAVVLGIEISPSGHEDANDIQRPSSHRKVKSRSLRLIHLVDKARPCIQKGLDPGCVPLPRRGQKLLPRARPR